MALITPHTALYDLPMDPDVARGERHVPRWLAILTFVFTWWIPLVLWRFRAYNKEALRAFDGKSGVVLVGNHSCYLDPYFVVMSAIFKQWPRFMAKADLFDKGNGLGGFFLARFGSHPIKRDTADRTAIKRGVRMLQAGEIVGIFPEGTRRGKVTDYHITLHTGAAFMARMADVPVLPVGIRGACDIYQEGTIHFPRISVHYGQPVYESDFDFLPRNQRLDVMTWFFMREVHALSLGVAPEDVDMDALYTGSVNYGELLRDFVPKSRPEGAAKAEQPESAVQAESAKGAAQA